MSEIMKDKGTKVGKARKTCMIAYAEYSYDARIKAYVRSIEDNGGRVDVFALREKGKGRGEKIRSSRIFYLTRKYQGSNGLFYMLSYLGFFLKALIMVGIFSFKEKYEAIHVHNMPNFLVFAATIPKLLGTMVILDVHDVMTVNYMTKFGVTEDHFLIKCLILEQRLSAAFSSHVLCADHMQKAYLAQVCKIPDRKITVVMNLPNEEIFRPVKREESNGKFRLIYHGTIAERLGIDIMLKAIAEVSNEIPVHLSVYGTGDFMSEALTLSEELGLNGKVYFSKTFFPTEMVPEMAKGMDLGIIGNRRNPATDKYMMPVKLLEYVYMKVPVVAPRLEIIRSYFDEGMIKYYEPENSHDLARCIEELYRSPEEREAYSEKASGFYGKHSWKIQAEEYLRLLPGYR